MPAAWIRRAVGGAGGGKRGRGRPRQDSGGELRSVSVTLPISIVERALRAGDGNLSLGLRRLLRGDLQA